MFRSDHPLLAFFFLSTCPSCNRIFPLLRFSTRVYTRNVNCIYQIWRERRSYLRSRPCYEYIQYTYVYVPSCFLYNIIYVDTRTCVYVLLIRCDISSNNSHPTYTYTLANDAGHRFIEHGSEIWPTTREKMQKYRGKGEYLLPSVPRPKKGYYFLHHSSCHRVLGEQHNNPTMWNSTIG